MLFRVLTDCDCDADGVAVALAGVGHVLVCCAGRAGRALKPIDVVVANPGPPGVWLGALEVGAADTFKVVAGND